VFLWVSCGSRHCSFRLQFQKRTFYSRKGRIRRPGRCPLRRIGVSNRPGADTIANLHAGPQCHCVAEDVRACSQGEISVGEMMLADRALTCRCTRSPARTGDYVGSSDKPLHMPFGENAPLRATVTTWLEKRSPTASHFHASRLAQCLVGQGAIPAPETQERWPGGGQAIRNRSATVGWRCMLPSFRLI
jgi:hypothetical protein